jgi:hypothetical protein
MEMEVAGLTGAAYGEKNAVRRGDHATEPFHPSMIVLDARACAVWIAQLKRLMGLSIPLWRSRRMAGAETICEFWKSDLASRKYR